MVLKLDMSMSYDILEWDFISGVLSSMRFLESFISMIHMCITTISYQVLINGQSSGIFSLDMGLRQENLHLICSYYVLMFFQVNRDLIPSRSIFMEFKCL